MQRQRSERPTLACQLQRSLGLPRGWLGPPAVEHREHGDHPPKDPDGHPERPADAGAPGIEGADFRPGDTHGVGAPAVSPAPRADQGVIAKRWVPEQHRSPVRGHDPDAGRESLRGVASGDGDRLRPPGHAPHWQEHGEEDG